MEKEYLKGTYSPTCVPSSPAAVAVIIATGADSVVVTIVAPFILVIVSIMTVLTPIQRVVV